MVEPEISTEGILKQETIPFMMHGAREVIDEGATYIQRQVISLEKAVSDENIGLVFDLSKSLIETTCKTILKDRKIVFADTENFSQLVRKTVNHLQIVPISHQRDPEIQKSLKIVVTGLNTFTKGLSEIRNKEGIASHGKDAYTIQLESFQAQLIARSTDAIVNFFFKVHRGYPGKNPVRGIDYYEQVDLNDSIDDENESVSIFQMVYKPSYILYKTDYTAYCAALSDYQSKESKDDHKKENPLNGLPMTGE
jgi:hypothetical protein